ncbi:MAG: beta-ketoacyl synthase [Cyanobacteria bacterium RYN_339]|nr:beta-ketoacyl synthase [Cyanobacteria bacterium RYN_339]
MVRLYTRLPVGNPLNAVSHLATRHDVTPLAGMLAARAAAHPDRRAFVFLEDGEAEGPVLTFAELDAKAQAIAAHIRLHAGPGDRAMLLYAPGLDYVAAFWGCLYAGVAAVPVYPPRDAKTAERLIAIAKDAKAKLALTTGELLAKTGVKRWIAPGLRRMKWLATDAVPAAVAPPAPVDPAAIGLVQYTSGSTGVPKGVLVTQANLAHNASLLQAAWDASGFGPQPPTFASWPPMYHDMGLIGKVVVPVAMGGTCVLMSPLHFLQRPARWLELISRYRADVSAGPNFAYDLCARRVPADGLDLSCWKVALNGAEPVRADALDRFATAFAPAGFRPEAFYPCYGMAEATLFVTGGLAQAAPTVLHLQPEALGADRVEVGAAGLPVVGVGKPWGDQRVRIVRDGQALGEDAIGEIWVAGPSIAAGYWQRPAETAEAFGGYLGADGPFLRTGDLGFLRAGELFVTGRLKDLVIIRGRNLYPQDLEASVAVASPGLRAGGGAAFGVTIDGEERLVVVQEVDKRNPPADAKAVLRAVREALAAQHDVGLHALVLVPAGVLPKTSSGKVQRHRARERYLAGALPAWQAP